MRPIAASLVFAWLLAVAGSWGCCAPLQRDCPPVSLSSSQTLVDLAADAEHSGGNERATMQAALENLKVDFARDQPAERKYNVLALSGGGSYGAFSAGVLNGWTATGERPTFDIVSGVSTGALIATYAFLGPHYDPYLHEFYTSVSADQIYRMRHKPAVLWSESAADSAPLAGLIERQVTCELLAAVAQAHAQGRRLYVGTTNLDTGRLVIWDLGAIASNGQPNSLELYRKVVLASASVPGFLPPVPIEVTVNGQTHTELHVDGGTTAQVFVRASMMQLNPSDFHDGRRPLVGSHVYVIVAGKSYPDPKCVEPKALKIAASSLLALTSAQTRNELVRIYTFTLLTGMSFHVSAVPQHWPLNDDSMSFDRAEMQRLFDQGYRLTLAGQAWSNLPPVLDASEQSRPRAGTEFWAPPPMAMMEGG